MTYKLFFNIICSIGSLYKIDESENKQHVCAKKQGAHVHDENESQYQSCRLLTSFSLKNSSLSHLALYIDLNFLLSGRLSTVYIFRQMRYKLLLIFGQPSYEIFDNVYPMMYEIVPVSESSLAESEIRVANWFQSLPRRSLWNQTSLPMHHISLLIENSLQI